MEQKETTTQQKESCLADNKSFDEKMVYDKSPTTSASSSNWWGGWISQAKEKSQSVLEAVKNDLNEITSAVAETFNTSPNDEELEIEPQKPADQQQQQQQSSTVNYMKQSLSSFFESVTDALIPQLDDDDGYEAVLITSDDTIVLTGFSKHLADLQNNDETFLEEPSKTTDLAEKYKMWLEIVEQDQFTQYRVDKMLESSQILFDKYNQLVPDTVSHMNFFKRYLFKKALLEDELANEERRRKEVVIEKQPEPVMVIEPQAEVKAPVPTTKAEIVSGLEPLKDLEIANFELSEEEQARLLDDYEQEIKEREKGKTEPIDDLPAPKSAMKTAKNPSKSNSNVQSKGKNNKNVKFQQQQQKSTQQQTKGEKGKPKEGGDLKMEKDHFKKESESSTSDESWEKEFDL